MAQLLLAREALPPRPPLAVACARMDGTMLGLATVDGRLVCQTLGPGTAPPTAYSVLLSPAGSAAPERLGRPWAALALLPGGQGLLFAQAGSRKLLFAPLPPGQGDPAPTKLCLFANLDAEVSCLALSPCGTRVLSGDAGGGLQLLGASSGMLLASAASAFFSSAGSSAAIVDACFLMSGSGGGDAVATADADGRVRLWTASGSGGGTATQLSVVGELDTGGRRSVRLAAAPAAGDGCVLAQGCADGAVLLWRRDVAGEWMPHSQLQLPGPVVDFSFSATQPGPAAPLLLAAAAPAEVLVAAVHAGAAMVVLREQVPASLGSSVAACGIRVGPDALIVCSSSGQVAELPVPAGGQPQSLAGWQRHQQQPAHSAPPSMSDGSARLPVPPKKAVRFAPEPATANPPPAEKREQPAATSLFARRALPPLPAHWGAQRSGLVPAALPEHRARSSTHAGPAAAYPVLAAPAPALASVVPELGLLLPLPGAAGAGGRASAPLVLTAAQHHAATTTEPQGPDMSDWQWGPAALPPRQQTPEAAPVQAGGAQEEEEEEEEERPRAGSVPVPLSRQQHQPAPRPRSPRPSSRQCAACQLARSPASSPQPASPAMVAALAEAAGQRAAARAEGQGSAASSLPRPQLPVKVGVLCTRQEQQGGQELPPETKKVEVAELELGSTHSQWRRQRYARLSRRCRSRGGQEQLVQEQEQVQAQEQEQQPVQQEQVQQGEDSGQQVHTDAPVAAAMEAAEQAQQEHGSGPEGQQAPALEGQQGQHEEAQRAPEVEEAAEVEDECGQEQPADTRVPAMPQFAVGSDEELWEGEEEPEQGTRAASPAAVDVGPWPTPAEQEASDVSAVGEASLMVWHVATSSTPGPQQAVAPGRSSSPGVCRPGHGNGLHEQLRQVESRLSGLVLRQQTAAPPKAASAQPARPAPVGVAEAQPPVLRASITAAPEEDPQPGCRLAVPQLNSSRLLLRRRQLLEAQASRAAKPTAKPTAEQEQQARVAAATAASTLPRHARLFPAPPPPPPESLAKPPPKATDPRWEAEQAELRPVLEQQWRREERLPAACYVAERRPRVVVPLPNRRALALEFLGLTDA